jgi:hypothetical protein
MDVVYAMASAHVGGADDLMVFVNVGSHWPADDPVVTRNPSLFSSDPRFGLRTSVPLPDDPGNDAPVEQATRAPGERRVTRRSA